MRQQLRARALGATALLAVATGAAATDGIDEGLLWQIDHDAAADPSYLFGTIHSADPRVLDLPEAVAEAFDEAQRYRFELDFGDMLEDPAMMRMFYLDGRRLSERLPEKLWERTREAAQQTGLGTENLEQMRPWAVATVMSVPDQEPTEILDYQLFDRAQARELPVEGLETVDEQLGIFDDLPLEQQVSMLETAVEYVEEGRVESTYEEMVGLYLEGDLAGMVAMAEEHPALPGLEDQEAFMRRLIEERNQIMVTRMTDDLRAGGTFVAIGALHLPGEHGVIRRLEQRGFSVTRIE